MNKPALARDRATVALLLSFTNCNGSKVSIFWSSTGGSSPNDLVVSRTRGERRSLPPR
jgi:hypothetical protein